MRTSFTTLQRRRRRRYGTRGPNDHFVPRLLALDAAKRQNNEHLQWVLLLLGSSPVLRTAFVEGLPWRLFFVLKCCYEQAFVERVFP